MTHKILLLAAILLLAGCSKPELPTPVHAIDVSWRYEQTLPDFRLTDAGGQAHSLSDFRGKVVVLFFGYTHCPEVCPTTLADLARVMRLLGPDAKRVQVLFITVDPERDTPDVLGKFVPAFDPSFIGLYGDAQATAQAARVFSVNYEKQFDLHGGYSVNHTDGTYIVGLTGRSVWLSPYGQRPDFLAEDIKLLLGKAH